MPLSGDTAMPDASGKKTTAAASPDRAAAPETVLAAFSRGDLDRRAAMGRLGVDYGELLDMVAARGLPLPAIPPERRRPMAELVASHVYRPGAGSGS